MKRNFLAVILLLCACLFLYGQNSNPIDLVLLLDTSSGMSSSYEKVNEYLTGAFLSEFLRIGDTFHLIVYSGAAKLDAARRIQGRGDVETIIGRILLQYPVENRNDLRAAIAFTEQYAAALPQRPKKIVIVGTGGSETNSILSAARQRLSSRNATLDFVQVTAGQSLANLPASGRPVRSLSSQRPAASAPRTPSSTSTAAQTPQASSQSAATTPASTTAATAPASSSTSTTPSPSAPASSSTSTTATTPPASTSTPSSTTTPSTSTAPATSPSTSAASTPSSSTAETSTTTPSTSASTSTADSSAPSASRDAADTPGESVGTDASPAADGKQAADKSGSSAQAVSEKTKEPGQSLVSSMPLIIALIILALIILILIIIFASRRLGSSPNRVMASASSYKQGKEKEEKFADHSKDLASYASRSGRRATPYENRPAKQESAKAPEINPTGPLLLNLFVEDQNTAIGKRNIHSLKSGYSFSVGGGKSDDYYIFLVPIPAKIGEIRREGSQCNFIPHKPKYFPDIGANEVKDCINKTIRIISDKNYELRFRFEMYEDPLIALNRVLTSVKVPG